MSLPHAGDVGITGAGPAAALRRWPARRAKFYFLSMIPFTGQGVLGVLIPLGVGAVAMTLANFFPSVRLFSMEMMEVFYGGITGVSALLVWVVGRRMNKDAVGMYVDPETREVIQYDREHTLCGIPLQGVSVVILILGAVIIYESRWPASTRWVSKQELQKMERQQREKLRDYAVLLSQFRVGLRSVEMVSTGMVLQPELPAEEQPGLRVVMVIMTHDIGDKSLALLHAKILQETTLGQPPPLLPAAAVAAGAKEEERVMPVLKVLRELVAQPESHAEEKRAAEALLGRYEMRMKEMTKSP